MKKRLRRACTLPYRSVKRWRDLSKKLAGSPLLPLLFIQEWLKVYVGTGVLLNDFLAPAVAATVLWVGVEDLKHLADDATDTVTEAVDED